MSIKRQLRQQQAAQELQQIKTLQQTMLTDLNRLADSIRLLNSAVYQMHREQHPELYNPDGSPKQEILSDNPR